MSEQNNANTAPVLEDFIREKLTGETQQNALDYVAFLRSNKLPLVSNSDGWFIGGNFENSIGFLIVRGDAQKVDPWTICFYFCDFGGNGSTNDELKETAWAYVNPCTKCHEGWKDCGRANRTVFGREFEALCLSPLAFNNPDGKTLESVKKLMLMLMQNRK